jgi:hypothetical protein
MEKKGPSLSKQFQQITYMAKRKKHSYDSSSRNRKPKSSSDEDDERDFPQPTAKKPESSDEKIEYIMACLDELEKSSTRMSDVCPSLILIF